MLRQQADELLLIHHRDAQSLGFLKLAARLCACKQSGGLFADTARHFRTQLLQGRLGIVSTKLRQGARMT